MLTAENYLFSKMVLMWGELTGKETCSADCWHNICRQKGGESQTRSSFRRGNLWVYSDSMDFSSYKVSVMLCKYFFF